MARGWESKSVEEQRSNASGEDGAAGITQDERLRAATLERAARERQKQSLHLQRELILSQRTSNPGRRAALDAALKQIEAQIAAIG
jgi:hypothetical protein